MKWLDNMKIRNKLFLSFMGFAAVTVSCFLFIVLLISNIGSSMDEQINSYQQRQNHMTNATTEMYRMRLAIGTKGFMMDSENISNLFVQMQKNFWTDAELFSGHLQGFRNTVNSVAILSEKDRQELLLVDRIDATFSQYLEIAKEMDEAAEAADQQELFRILGEITPVGNRLAGQVQDLNDLLLTAASLNVLETINEASAIAHMVIAILLGFLLLLAFVLFFSVKGITRPISQLKTGMEEIANGNLAYPIRSDRKDEIGVLANSMGDMVIKLTEYDKTKLLMEQLDEALKAAETASKAKSSFLANMSHEIRTPMNAIMGITEIQLHDESLDLNTREAFQRIFTSGDLLLNIINDILDLSKIEAGKLDLISSQYDIPSLINDTATLNMMRIGSKPIEFELSVDENIPYSLHGDELRIKQILNNLLSNAFKFTEEGTVKLSVRLDPGGLGDGSDLALVFEISDTGQGMTKEQVDKLFDQYARFNTEANRMIEGTGLGMSITQNLIKLMNGSISVKSTPSLGSTFTVRLPQKGASSKVLGKELAENLENFKANGVSQLKRAQVVFDPMPYGSVLIVDDVESNLYVAKGLMSPYQLAIATVASGFAAIDKIKEGNLYDIVFMDHMMPEMDGMEATKQIRELGYDHAIVALTANAVVGQSQIFLDNGFDDFIPKPIDVRQLNAVLKKYIRDKQPPEVLESIRRQKDIPAGTPTQKPEQVDPYLLELFIRDASKSIKMLDDILEAPDGYERDARSYVLNVHSLKSGLANIGERGLSGTAAELEQAGRDGDTAIMAAKTPAFLNDLHELIKKLTPKQEDMEHPVTTKEGGLDYLHTELLAVKEACEMFQKKAAKGILAELQQKAWPHSIKDFLDALAEHLLRGDYDEISSAIDRMLENGP